MHTSLISSFFFFNDTATTEIYTLSLHDALPIYFCDAADARGLAVTLPGGTFRDTLTIDNPHDIDRKSTRLNSSHSQISYAVFCLKKKKKELIMRFNRYIMKTTYHGH